MKLSYYPLNIMVLAQLEGRVFEQKKIVCQAKQTSKLITDLMHNSALYSAGAKYQFIGLPIVWLGKIETKDSRGREGGMAIFSELKIADFPKLCGASLKKMSLLCVTRQKQTCPRVFNLTIKPEASQYVFVRLLLRRLWTDGHQTWQERRGRSQKKHSGTWFHGNG